LSKGDEDEYWNETEDEENREATRVDLSHLIHGEGDDHRSACEHDNEAVIAHECRVAIDRFKLQLNEARENKESLDPGIIHAQAIQFVLRANDALMGYREDYLQYPKEAESVSRAVGSSDPATADEAIAELIELNRVIEQQVSEHRF
jgi:hypothetical protein